MLIENIKHYIEDNNMNQTAIARKAGITKQAMSSVMNGKRKLQADEYLSICKVLGVSADFFAH